MGTYLKYHSKYVDWSRPPNFLRVPGVDVKNGSGSTREKKYFSHIQIFRTNVHMYKTKHAFIQYCLSPFQ